MKNIFFLIAFLIVITSLFTNCIETDTDFELPFEQTPVAIGFLDSMNGARVFVGKNVAIFSKDSSAVKGATVSLWSEESFIENLIFLDKNVFISSPNFKPLPNKNYSFRATVPLPTGLGQVRKDSLISEKITLPTTIPIKKAYVRYMNQRKTLVNIYIQIDDPVGFNGYSFNVQRFKKDTLFDDEIAGNPLYIPFNGILTNDREFQGLEHTFVFENVNIEEFVNRRSILMDKIKITLFNLSKPTYDLFQSLRTPEPGTGDPFFEPTIISNQLKNGLGVFGTYSSFTYELRL